MLYPTRLILLLSSLLSLPSFATVKLELRSDFESKDYSDSIDKSDSWRFYFPYARMFLKHDLNEKVYVLGRFNLLTDAATQGNLNKRDNTNELISTLWVNYQHTPELALRAGKLGSIVLANEGSYLSFEQYFLSQANSNTMANYNGIAARYTMKESIYDIQIANQEQDSLDANQNLQQNRGLVSLRAKPKFIDNTLSPVVTYLESHPQGASPERKNSYLGIGVHYDFPDTSYAELDYLRDEFVDRGTTLSGSRATDTVESWVGKVSYLLNDANVLILKAESSKSYFTAVTSGADTVTDSKWLVWALAIEHKPDITIPMRLHAAVIESNQSPTVNGSKQTDRITHTVTVGFRIDTELGGEHKP